MKEQDAQEALRVALQGGPWPSTELVELVAIAVGCDRRTVQRAAHQIGVQLVRRSYWLAPDMSTASVSYHLDGFPRERLIRHLVCRQEPRATTSDCSREASLDELHELMGAESVYEQEFDER